MELTALGRLLDQARRADARFVFVSSQTARPDAPTAYGRLKWRAEQMILAQGGIVVRPGQVYGGREQALWGRLARLARKPLLPRFLPDPVLQPIHVDDLAACLTRLAQDRGLAPRIYAIADPQPVALSRFLSDTAYFRRGRMPFFVPVPAAAVRLSTGLLEGIGLVPGPLKQLSSLLSLPRLDSAADLAVLDCPIRAFGAWVGRGHAYRRALLREGRTLLTYVLAASPDRQSLESYVRTIEATADARPLQLPPLVHRLPLLTALFDRPSGRLRAGWDDLLTIRLDIALVVAEGGPAQADRFLLAPTRRRRFVQALAAATALTGDIVFRLLGALLRDRLDRHRPRTGHG
jgi:hypothetical protein